MIILHRSILGNVERVYTGINTGQFNARWKGHLFERNQNTIYKHTQHIHECHFIIEILTKYTTPSTKIFLDQTDVVKIILIHCN